jgi:hypothetical protein
MLVLNRDTYDIQEYGFIRNVNVTIMQFYILEALQSGRLLTYYDIAEWVQKRNKERLITMEALNTAISRLRKLGFNIKGQVVRAKFGKCFAYQLQTEMWEK